MPTIRKEIMSGQRRRLFNVSVSITGMHLVKLAIVIGLTVGVCLLLPLMRDEGRQNQEDRLIRHCMEMERQVGGDPFKCIQMFTEKGVNRELKKVQQEFENESSNSRRSP